jgi:hypothetical protein
VKSLVRLVFLVLLLVGWGLAATSLHVIRLPSAACPILLVPRACIATSLEELGETYVDARTWTIDDAAKHPAIIRRVLETGKAGYLQHLSDPESSKSFETQLIEAVQRGERKNRAEDDVRADAGDWTNTVAVMSRVSGLRSRDRH